MVRENYEVQKRIFFNVANITILNMLKNCTYFSFEISVDLARVFSVSMWLVKNISLCEHVSNTML